MSFPWCNGELQGTCARDWNVVFSRGFITSHLQALSSDLWPPEPRLLEKCQTETAGQFVKPSEGICLQVTKSRVLYIKLAPF